MTSYLDIIYLTNQPRRAIIMRDGASGYSPVEHLARSIWLKGWREGLLGMFTGYYDASGGRDTGFMAVAGFVADVRKWEVFEGSWRLVLAKFDLPYFHMKEFAPSRGPFESWKGQETKRANLLRDLIQVVHETADFWISCSMRNEILDVATKRYGVRFDGGAYPLVARFCIARAHEFMRKRHGKAEIQHVFESGDQGKGKLVGMIERLNNHAKLLRVQGKRDPKMDPYPIPLPIFKPSRDTATEKGLLPLQAADLVAWEFHKMHREARLDSIQLRRPLQELRKRLPGEYTVMRQPGVMRLIESEIVRLRQ